MIMVMLRVGINLLKRFFAEFWNAKMPHTRVRVGPFSFLMVGALLNYRLDCLIFRRRACFFLALDMAKFCFLSLVCRFALALIMSCWVTW